MKQHAPALLSLVCGAVHCVACLRACIATDTLIYAVHACRSCLVACTCCALMPPAKALHLYTALSVAGCWPPQESVCASMRHRVLLSHHSLAVAPLLELAAPSVSPCVADLHCYNLRLQANSSKVRGCC
jgi:hypothetical protein